MIKRLLLLVLLLSSYVAAAQIGQRSVTLTWTESTPGITTFQVYRSATSGGQGGTPLAIVPGTQFSYIDLAVTGGQTWYYVVSATLGVESGPSAEVKAVVPTAPAPPALTVVVK